LKVSQFFVHCNVTKLLLKKKKSLLERWEPVIK